MKPSNIYGVACLLSVLLLAGCSRLNDFVIVNSSNKPVGISIQYSREVFELKIAGVEQYEGSNDPWQILSADQCEIDPDSKTVTLNLPPHRALLVAQAINYTGHDTETFEIVKLTIGQEQYEGKEAQKLFQPGKNDNFEVQLSPQPSSR
jgi:hypothetical protein